MGRPKKEERYRRVQFYLVPELESIVRCYANDNKMKISMYIRTALEKYFNEKQRGNNGNERP